MRRRWRSCSSNLISESLCKIIRSGEYASRHFQNIRRLGHDVSGRAQALPHCLVVGRLFGASLADAVLQIEVGSVCGAGDAGDAVEEGLRSWAIRNLRVCCLVVEVIGLPLIQRPPLHDQVVSCRRVCLHFLRSGAAEDVCIENGGLKAGSALESVVGKDGSWVWAGDAGLPIKIGYIDWAGL